MNEDGSNRDFLLSEGLESTEAFVALTNIDEENVLLTLFAKKHSKGKLVTKINRLEFDDILAGLDLGSIVYPKYMTCDYIVQYVRALQNEAGNNIKTLYRILGDRVEALEFTVHEESRATGVPLSQLHLKRICCSAASPAATTSSSPRRRPDPGGRQRHRRHAGTRPARPAGHRGRVTGTGRMNYAIVFRLLGYILMIEGTLLLLPAVTSLIYAEWAVMGVFLLTAAISAALGFALRTIKPRSKVFYMREGFAATALSWITISIMGAVPFVLTGCIPNPVDAMFETVSGFTTTGASILPGVEGLPNGILFWRSFTHWIGGMGVLVFLLSLLPLTGGSHVNLMKAESPGPQVDKLVPKVQSTAKILYGIYFALTVVEFCFLLAGGMNVFDSLLTAFGTAGTGGFGFKNDSFASFSPYIQWVVTVFMILFGVNFNVYFLLLLRRFRRAASSEEVRAYFAIILAAVAVITVNIRSLYGTFGEALRHAAFQVGSIITTTGFSSCDFDLWPTLAKEVLVLLMFVGACAGSTGGGIKVSRFLLLGKTLGKELKQALHPQVVAPVRMDGKLVNHETIRTTNVFLAAYIFIFAASFMLVSLDGFDMVTNFTSIAATLNNIGPGLNQVGPMMNFGAYSNFAKLVLIFDMLAGRLEIFPMLVLFLPDAWRRF